MTSYEQLIIDSLTKTLNMTDEEFKTTIPKNEHCALDDPDLVECSLSGRLSEKVYLTLPHERPQWIQCRVDELFTRV